MYSPVLHREKREICRKRIAAFYDSGLSSAWF